MSSQEIANIYSSINNIQLGLNEVTGNTFSNYNQLSRIVSQQANIYNTVYYGTGNMSTGNLVVSANCNISGNLIMNNGNLNITRGNVIMSNGNLGLGTTSPMATLDISGNARITGNVSVGSWNSSPATHLGYQALSGASSREWTGIPSWANETTIAVESASLTAAANITIQVGISSGYITSGYIAASTSTNYSLYVSGLGVVLWNPSGAASDFFSATLKFIYVGTNGSTYYYNITGTGAAGALTPNFLSTFWGRIATTEKINSIRVIGASGTFDNGIAGVYYF